MDKKYGHWFRAIGWRRKYWNYDYSHVLNREGAQLPFDLIPLEVKDDTANALFDRVRRGSWERRCRMTFPTIGGRLWRFRGKCHFGCVKPWLKVTKLLPAP